MSAEDKKVVVKKVSPYPIDIVVDEGGKPIKGQIAKLTLRGYLVYLGHEVTRVGNEHDVNFTIPVLQKSIAVRVKTVKTYDQFRPPPLESGQVSGPDVSTSVAHRLAEQHFLNLSEDQRTLIYQFLKKIGQAR